MLYPQNGESFFSRKELSVNKRRTVVKISAESGEHDRLLINTRARLKEIGIR